MSQESKKPGLFRKLIAKLNELFNETDDEGGSGGSGVKPITQNPVAGNIQKGQLPSESANKGVYKPATDSPYVPLIRLVRSLIQAAGLSQEKYPGKSQSILRSTLPTKESGFKSTQTSKPGESATNAPTQTPDSTPENNNKQPSNRKTPGHRPR